MAYQMIGGRMQWVPDPPRPQPIYTQPIYNPPPPPPPRETYPRQPVDHHVFPQQRELRDWFTEKGIDIHDTVVRIDRGHHEWLHTWWNPELRDFKANNPNASRADIENKVADMMARAGIDELPMHRYGRFRPHFE